MPSNILPWPKKTLYAIPVESLFRALPVPVQNALFDGMVSPYAPDDLLAICDSSGKLVGTDFVDYGYGYITVNRNFMCFGRTFTTLVYTLAYQYESAKMAADPPPRLEYSEGTDVGMFFMSQAERLSGEKDNTYTAEKLPEEGPWSTAYHALRPRPPTGLNDEE